MRCVEVGEGSLPLFGSGTRARTKRRQQSGLAAPLELS
jgi:hypothetical protein